MSLENIIIPGFPFNPNPKAAALFPGNYLVGNNSRFDTFLQIMLDGVTWHELHLQDPTELPSNQEEYALFQRWAEARKQNEINTMGHLPFVTMKDPSDPKPFAFDFLWPVVPREYDGKPVINIPNNPIYGRQISDETVYKTIDLMAGLGIPIMTVHATKPFVRFSEDDIQRYIQKIREYRAYGQRKGVEIAVETGGLTIQEMRRVVKETGCKINLDTAHLFLDLCFDYKDSLNGGAGAVLERTTTGIDINMQIFNFFNELVKNNNLGVLHLTQTYKGADMHRGLYQDGQVGCNEPILLGIQEQLKQGNSIPWMVEGSIHQSNFTHVLKTISGFSDSGQVKEPYLTVFMGLPGTGKTESSRRLQKYLGTVFRTDDLHDLFERSRDSFNAGCVTEDIKQMVYDLIRQRAAEYIANGPVAIDATFHLRERRSQLWEIYQQACKQKPFEFYVIFHVADDATLNQRFDEREKQLAEMQARKEYVPYHMYHHSDLESLRHAYTPFSVSEFPTAHVIIYDTSNWHRSITMHNPDERLRSMAAALEKSR